MPAVRLPAAPPSPGRQYVVFDLPGGQATVVDAASDQQLCPLTPCVADLPVGTRAIRFRPLSEPGPPGQTWDEGTFAIQVVQDAPLVVRHLLARTIKNDSLAGKVGMVLVGIGGIGALVVGSVGVAPPDKGEAAVLLASLGVAVVTGAVGLLLLSTSRDHVVLPATTQWTLPQPPAPPAVPAVRPDAP
jgi:hypothetical protein